MKIKIFDFSKIHFIVLGFIGMVLGILYSFGGLIYDIIHNSVGYGTLLAFLALIGMPLIFSIFGFLLGLFVGIIFNFINKYLKLNIQLEDKNEKI
ncbi:hypothetical protein [Marinitoga aeolica]|uniref:DUF3566 domain-containing protein n=1 Tax=Marinitoga aeolica TaxID=2809031 RepID=A0ABY8PQQ1_9BACT|nr:hypothetical protein [Marinitoga aeolica]WGS64944.1 hypothetical protein JRV97_11405 [Marinitoga aeolica]